MTQLMAFYGLEAVVGALIGAAAMRLRVSSARCAWRDIGIAGGLIAAWSGFKLYGLLIDTTLPAVGPVILLGIAAVLTTGFREFGRIYGKDAPSKTIDRAVGVVTVVTMVGQLLLGRYAAVPVLAVALVVLLPGMHALIQLYENKTHLWGPFIAAAGVFWLYLAVALYNVACPGCTGGVIPAAVYTEIIRSQQVRMLGAVLLLAFGCYLFLHGVVRQVVVDNGEETVSELLEATVTNLGAIVGEDVAAQMAADAVEQVTDTRPKVENREISATDADIPMEELVNVLIDEFGTIGPVGERKVRETALEMGVSA